MASARVTLSPSRTSANRSNNRQYLPHVARRSNPVPKEAMAPVTAVRTRPSQGW
jgi:hypothetical protein